jgi:Brp/Blh family beta-carotene 15,15'-monooxygenase
MFKFFDISLNVIGNNEYLKNLVIVLTFFGLWLSTQLNSAFQDYVAYALILTFGILHGSNDITLIASISNKKRTSKRLLLTYLGAIVMVSLLFLISKALALLFFIVISAYHFGEQHLGECLKSKTKLKTPFFLFYGFVILFMIFTIKVNEVIAVISDVTGLTLQKSLFLNILLGVSAGLLCISLKLIRDRILVINPIKELFYLGVLAIVFANSSLVWGFAIYFIFWHSLPSLKDQLDFLYGKATKKDFLKYLKASSVYWLISVVGLFGLYWFLKDSVDFFITVVLYVLAAITFPHVLVMSKVEALKR